MSGWSIPWFMIRKFFFQSFLSNHCEGLIFWWVRVYRVVCCVRFSPDGKVLATGCNRNTTLYDTKTGAKIS